MKPRFADSTQLLTDYTLERFGYTSGVLLMHFSISLSGVVSLATRWNSQSSDVGTGSRSPVGEDALVDILLL